MTFQDSLFSQKPVSVAPPVESVQGVSRVVDYIRRVISQNKTLAAIRVRGEVSGLSNKNGRLYFDLKENMDVLRCVVWASDAQKLPPFKDGDEIICGGEYSTFAQRSQYQLFVKSVELTGIGVLYAQFEALKEQFRKEGLFEESRKRAMPAFPRRIAVVSARGKGAEDFLTTIARRAPFIDVTFIETRVQGDGAQIDIAEAIDKASKLDVDVIVLTRGGGSYEDLFPYNLEPVVRAVVRAKHPVLSAVGHTGDVHLSDYAADKTCETPSNAAQYFGEIADRFYQRVQRARTNLEHIARSLLASRAQRLDYAGANLNAAALDFVRERERTVHTLQRRLDAQTPQRRLVARAQGIGGLTSRLNGLGTTLLRGYHERLTRLDMRLGDLSPHALLARGYAIVTVDGRIVRDAQSVAEGALMEAQLHHGKLQARVERKDDSG